MNIESVYELRDGSGYVAEFSGPALDVELVVFADYDVATWVWFETGAIVGEVEIGRA